MFSHYLVTRFNVPFVTYEKDKNGKKVRDHDWLEDRFELFEMYCFPSVISQNNKNFKWLVFFDSQTPEKYINRINKLKELSSNILIPVYISSGNDFLLKLNDIIVNLLGDKRYVITSRIDNDDSLHFSYIKTIQERFTCQKDVILNFKHGYIYDINTNILYRTKHASNPFISRIELVNDSMVKSVMAFQHNDAINIANLVQIEKVIGWVQIIHKGNLSNQANGIPQLFVLKKLENYNINLTKNNFKLNVFFTRYFDYLAIIFFVILKKIRGC